MKLRSDRRTFIKSAAVGIVGMSLPASLFAQAVTDSGTVKLSDDLFILRLPGEANVLVQIDAKGVLLVDGGSAKGSDALLKAVSGLPGAGPVHTLFNTHWHPEQTGSNERLGKAGVTIIAHENTRLWLGQNVTWPWNGKKFAKLPKIAQPNHTFYTKDKLDSGITYGYI